MLKSLKHLSFLLLKLSHTIFKIRSFLLCLIYFRVILCSRLSEEFTFKCNSLIHGIVCPLSMRLECPLFFFKHLILRCLDWLSYTHFLLLNLIAYLLLIILPFHHLVFNISFHIQPLCSESLSIFLLSLFKILLVG